jgi:hypothetical protein
MLHNLCALRKLAVCYAEIRGDAQSTRILPYPFALVGGEAIVR